MYFTVCAYVSIAKNFAVIVISTFVSILIPHFPCHCSAWN